MPPNPTEDIWKERENQLQISHAERKTLPFDLFLTDFCIHIDYFGRYIHIIEYNTDFVYRQVKFEKNFKILNFTFPQAQTPSVYFMSPSVYFMSPSVYFMSPSGSLMSPSGNSMSLSGNFLSLSGWTR